MKTLTLRTRPPRREGKARERAFRPSVSGTVYKPYISRKNPMRFTEYAYNRGAKGKPPNKAESVICGSRWNYFQMAGKVTPLFSRSHDEERGPPQSGIMRDMAFGRGGGLSRKECGAGREGGETAPHPIKRAANDRRWDSFLWADGAPWKASQEGGEVVHIRRHPLFRPLRLVKESTGNGAPAEVAYIGKIGRLITDALSSPETVVRPAADRTENEAGEGGREAAPHPTPDKTPRVQRMRPPAHGSADEGPVGTAGDCDASRGWPPTAANDTRKEHPVIARIRQNTKPQGRGAHARPMIAAGVRDDCSGGNPRHGESGAPSVHEAEFPIQAAGCRMPGRRRGPGYISSRRRKALQLKRANSAASEPKQ